MKVRSTATMSMMAAEAPDARTSGRVRPAPWHDPADRAWSSAETELLSIPDLRSDRLPGILAALRSPRAISYAVWPMRFLPVAGDAGLAPARTGIFQARRP